MSIDDTGRWSVQGGVPTLERGNQPDMPLKYPSETLGGPIAGGTPALQFFSVGAQASRRYGFTGVPPV